MLFSKLRIVNPGSSTALCTASPSQESIVASASMTVIRPVRFMDEYTPLPQEQGSNIWLMPTSRRAILGAMLTANPTLLEPVLGIEVKGPTELIGAVTGVISGKRGKLVNIEQKEVLTVVEGAIPAAETFDLSEVMRGATAGNAGWNTHFKLWDAVRTKQLLTCRAYIRKGEALRP